MYTWSSTARLMNLWSQRVKRSDLLYNWRLRQSSSQIEQLWVPHPHMFCHVHGYEYVEINSAQIAHTKWTSSFNLATKTCVANRSLLKDFISRQLWLPLVYDSNDRGSTGSWAFVVFHCPQSNLKEELSRLSMVTCSSEFSLAFVHWQRCFMLKTSTTEQRLDSMFLMEI
jgi:hypothetical protein